MKLVAKGMDRVNPVTKQQSLAQMGQGSAGFLPFGGGVGKDSWRKDAKEVDFDVLRIMRAAIPWVAAGIDMRRDQVIHAAWAVGPIVPDDDYDEATVDLIKAKLTNPDPEGYNYDFGGFWGPITEDILSVGKGAIQPFTDDTDGLTHMRYLDARRVKEDEKWDPDSDLVKNDVRDENGAPVMPRYWYLDDTDIMKKGKPLSSDELILIKPNPVTYQIDGLSPMQSLWSFLHAERDTFRSIHLVQKTRQAPGFLKVPDAQPGTIDKLTRMWNERILGKFGIGIVDIPPQADWVAMGEINLSSQGAFAFYDILVRGVAAALRTSTVALGWTFDVNRTTADAQGDFNDEGILNLLRLIQSAINNQIVRRYENSHNIHFTFTQLPVEDEAEGADAIRTWSGAQFIVPSPDELRDKAGLKPIERKKNTLLDRAYRDMWVASGGTFLPVFLALGVAANQMSPGYDPDTGEIDKEKAAEEQAALAPPQLQPFAQGAGADGNPPNGKPDGNPPNGKPDDGNPPNGKPDEKKPPFGNLATVAKKADEEIQRALDEQLGELDAIFRERLTAARQSRKSSLPPEAL